MTAEHLKTLHGHRAEAALNEAVAACGPIPDGYEIDLFNGDNPEWGWISADSEAWGFASLEDAVKAARVHAAKGVTS